MASTYSACAVLDSGGVKCWGDNNNGQLGNGTTVDSSTPVSVLGISSAESVITEDMSVCAILGSGEIQCWGDNSYGQLGDGTVINSLVPVTVAGITTAVSANTSGYNNGAGYFCAVLSDGKIRCWGNNSSGIFGDGTRTSTCETETTCTEPSSVSGINNAESVSTGSGHACAVLAMGYVKCWGLNHLGQLGNGTISEEFYLTPGFVKK
jgi:alpha-tubulin suppressor-like RCC1 family protein